MKTINDNLDKSVYAGIDVGKAGLDVSIAVGPARHFANTDAGIGELLEYLRVGGANFVVCEPSGGYERCLVAHLRLADMRLFLVPPRQAREFARLCGQYAKTDAIDAKMLAGFGERIEVRESPPIDEKIQCLRGLMKRRHQLIGQRVEEHNRLEKGPDKAVMVSLKRHIAWLTKEIVGLDKARAQLFAEAPELAQRKALYESVKGIGDVASSTLVGLCRRWAWWAARRLPRLPGWRRGRMTAVSIAASAACAAVALSCVRPCICR